MIFETYDDYREMAVSVNDNGSLHVEVGDRCDPEDFSSMNISQDAALELLIALGEYLKIEFK